MTTGKKKNYCIRGKKVRERKVECRMGIRNIKASMNV